MPAVSRLPSLRVRIWDLPLRLFHWTLLTAVVTAAVTGFLLPVTWLDIHLTGGTAVAALLVFRLVWGFTGSAYSRFASFAFSPLTIIGYARDQFRGRARHYAGHNPMGAAMILALLVTLAAIVVTGIIVLGGAEKQGPLKAFISYASGMTAREVHEIAAFGLLALIAGHVGGVILESRRTRENLPLSMVTGVKTAAESATVPARPVAALLSLAVLGAAVGIPAYLMWLTPAAGVPGNALSAEYVRECGDCHIAFHPSLRGKTTWASIMSTLDDHFGEDASLDAGLTATLAAYLDANAAEQWDTRAANVFRSAEPLRVTETTFWRRRHAEVDQAVFKSKKVGTRSNCEACHGDARQGLFMPQAINIPKE